MKRKMLRTFEDRSEELDTFTLYNIKFDSSFLSRLRVMFITPADIKENPEISSYTEQDFANPITQQNENAVSQALRDLISVSIAEMKTRRKNILENIRFSKFEEELLDQLVHQDFDFGNISEIERNLVELSDFQKQRIRNFLMSQKDLNMLQKNLEFLNNDLKIYSV